MAERRACFACGGDTWSEADPPLHRSCRPQPHGTPKSYGRGCRCDECRDAKTDEMRRYRAMVIERDGISPTQKYRPAKKKPCLGCGEPMRNGGSRCAPCKRRQQALRRASRKLAEAARGAAPHLDWPWVVGTCVECGTDFTRKGQASPYCSTACSRRERIRQRRARKRDAFVARVHKRRVFDRDGWACQLCGKPVQRSKPAPHPMSPVLDHIVPLAAGGTHEPANVQCAHFLCNSLKRDQPANDQLRLIG